MSDFTPTFDGTSDVGEAIEVPMERLVRKGPGIACAQANYLNVEHVIEENTTLNQELGILTDEHYTFGEDPYYLGWFQLGIKGYQPGTGANGEPVPYPYTSDPNDLGLYLSVPLCLREKTNPLTQSEEENFFLKRSEEYNGVEYYAYYAYAMDRNASAAETYTREATKDADLVPYTYKPEDLTPEPKLAPAEGETPKITSSMIVLTPVTCRLPAFLVKELKAAINIVYGGIREISEIAFIQGAVKEVQDTDGNGNIYQRKELVDAQIGTSGVTSIIITGTNQDIPATYRLGGAEAVYASE